jgi:NAD(P)-dependent dehydrogenase (short-subunit alcohol dehydrogenase family)
MGRVEGKVAIVTGAASGIGRATALLLAREGARVVIADRDGAGAERVAREIEAAGGQAQAARVDVSEEPEVEAMVAAAVARFGGLHVLHNNAALTDLAQHALDASLVAMQPKDWDRSLAVNLRGAMLCAKHSIPHMIRSGGGSIVNMSSNQALSGDLTQFAYAAAKAGVAQLTRSIATAYGRQGIRANTISPGMIRTPGSEAACPPEVFAMIESHSLVGRNGEPLDIAWAVLFLASDESSFITGQTLCVDGGQLAHLPHYADLLRAGTTTTGVPRGRG